MENVGFDRSIGTQVGVDLLAFAVNRFPSLKNANIEHHWAGFRPASSADVIVENIHNWQVCISMLGIFATA